VYILNSRCALQSSRIQPSGLQVKLFAPQLILLSHVHCIHSALCRIHVPRPVARRSNCGVPGSAACRCKSGQVFSICVNDLLGRAADQQLFRNANQTNTQGWPEPYICTVYDRIFGNFPAENTVFTPYMHGSGQP
jgi:hypothetical protein